ncbi:hypothetical protein F7725_006827 [Dissostichus mawsoni]|uniref:Uncharacterized protein n=1 Tax=Dissostichus mawsoni TaxID=36200 RepID=A0A7J5XV18_DISMA|nr:hypothetical protein F7725_006827 [Dissostichus mawsoni]
MASFVSDYLFCLLPSLLLLLLSLGLCWPRVCCWTRLAVSAVGWRLWVLICLILELPLDRNIRTGTEDILCSAAHLQTLCSRHISAAALWLSGQAETSPWPRGDPHLQTLSSLLWEQHGDTLQFTRDNLLLRDGGIVALDWAVGTRLGEFGGRRRGGRKELGTRGNTLGCFTTRPPVLLLIPESWGGMTPHLKVLCHQAVRQGFYVVVFHARGTAGCPLTSARLTEFGDPADLEQVLAYVHSRHPSSVMVAVSEGSGSGTLLSYLGESGSSSCLKAAAAISPVLRGQLGVLDVDRALSCSSLRDFEETLSCSRPPKTSLNSGPDSPRVLAPSVAWALGERAYPAKDWENYWERNEPLRDADVGGSLRDDPLLPPASTLPLPLFQSNPYFLLVLTDRGGHCGFTLEGPEETEGGRTGNEEEEEGGNWSHIAVLEYFRVVADFLKGEEKDGEYIQAGPRSRTSNMAPPRRRRANVMRRQRLQPTEERSGDEEEGNFTWKRSYTR